MDSHEFNNIKQYRQPGAKAPTPVIKRIAYNANNDPQYIGFALQGTATSTATWTIEQLNYDGSNNYSYSLFATGVAWDNRATSTYT